MKLFRKGLLLVAIPGLFELGLLGILYKSQDNATEAEVWALHTKNVIIKAAEVREPILMQSARLRAALLFNDVTVYEKTDLWEKIDQEMSDLKKLCAENPTQMQRIMQMEYAVQEYRNWVQVQADYLRNNRRDELIAVLRDPNTIVRVQVILQQISDFIEVEQGFDTMRLERLMHARKIQNVTLFLALLGSLLAAAMAAKIFSKNVGDRLAILSSNAHRLSEGGALADAVGGNDEISALDQVLHQTSRRLRQAEQNARLYREELECRARELARVNADLQRQTQDNEMFIYSVSHDLRSPLVNLDGFSKELELAMLEIQKIMSAEHVSSSEKKQIEEIIEQEIAGALKFIRTAVTRSSAIIDAMLRLSRAGRVEYQMQTVMTDQVVERVIEAMSSTIRQRQALVMTHRLPPCYGDPTAIEQVFGNLIGNAIYYLDPQRAGTVEVGVLPEDAGTPGFRTYFVKDNGLGIAACQQDKLFSAFNRLHADAAEGEGVGLALIKRIVLRHGGKIWLQSKEGVGTIFYTSLPVVPIPSRHETPPA